MTARPTAGSALRRRGAPALAAVIVGGLGMVLAAVLPGALGLDPFTARATAFPVAVMAACTLVLLALWVLTRSDLAVGAAAGVVASTVALGLNQILLGTPYAPGGLVGDIARYTALSTRYTVTSSSADAVIPGAPSEYPPLLPWVIGKSAVLLDRPAWTLVAPAMTILTAAAVIAAFWLWNRLTSAPVALVLSALPPLLFTAPDKAFHLFALALLAPWVLVTFAGLPRAAGGLHWAWAGVVGAAQVLVYPGYLVFASLGIAAVIAIVWWRCTHRAAYARHVAGTGAVGLALVGWYVVPFLAMRGSFSTGSVSDRFDSLLNYADPAHLPPTVLPTHPILLGMWLLGALSLAWWASRGRTWAWVMAALVIGVYVYRTARLLGLVATGSTGFLQYTSRILDVLLCSAAVLGTAAALPAAARRARLQVPAAVPALLVLLATSMAPLGYLDANRLPVGAARGSAASLQAQIEPLPDCSLPQYSPSPVPAGEVAPVVDPDHPASLAFTPVDCFPAARVRRAVESVLGAGALPVTVSYSERLWAFYPWFAFITNDRTAAGLYQNYDARLPVLEHLSSVDDPERLASLMSSTAFGPIDVLVLRSSGPDLVWAAGGQRPTTVTFRRSQFAGARFRVVDVGHSTTVVVRLAADVVHAAYPA